MSDTKGKKQTLKKHNFSVAAKKRREKKRKNKDKRNVPPKKAFKKTNKRKRVNLEQKVPECPPSDVPLKENILKDKNKRKRRRRRQKNEKRRGDTRTIKSLYVKNNDFSPVVQSGLDDYQIWMNALKKTIKAQEDAVEKGEIGPLSSLDPELYEKIKLGLNKNGNGLPERTHLWDYGYKKMEGFSSIARMKSTTREMTKFMRELFLINMAQKSYNFTRSTGSKSTRMQHVQLAKDHMSPISWGENRPMGTRILKKRPKKNKTTVEDDGEEETSEDLIPLAQEIPVE